MLLCGIDPGLTGAIAFLDQDKASAKLRVVSLEPMPVTYRGAVTTKASVNRLFQARLIDWQALIDALHEQRPDLIVIEEQWARPKEGVTSSFRSGGAYTGLLVAATALRLPYEIIYPARWKNALGLRKTEKDASRLLAIKLFPECSALLSRKKDHGLAEALLIATWKAAYEHIPLTDDLGSRGGRQRRSFGEPAETC